jgi:trehalose/maltose hydrolase-like predicted phosphorylase
MDMRIFRSKISERLTNASCIGLISFFMIANSLHAQDPWKITVNRVDTANYYGVTVANGILGLVSSSRPLQTSCTVLAGCYDKFGRGDVSNFLSGFNFLNTSLFINDQKIEYSHIDHYMQELDMKNAEFNACFDCRNEAKVSYSFISLRQLPYCALLVVDITPFRDITIKTSNIQDLPDGFHNRKGDYDHLTVGHAKACLMSTAADSPTGRLKVCACSTFLFPSEGNNPAVIHQEGNDRQDMYFVRQLKKGKTYRFAVVGSTLSSAQNPDPVNEVKRLAVYCQMEGVDKLLAHHRALWGKLWESDIQIDGDAQAQQDIHSMMYHLYSFVREGSDLSISPMGLSGLGYNGHVFWDADTWMFPALLLLHPELAKSMIDYRYNHLAEAKKNAFEHGYKGAQYVWESSDTGFEDTPVFAMTGPFEHSITGCVGFAAWQYYCVTRDKNWLGEKGYPILKETADFWLSRVTQGEDGYYHIPNVVAADEWAENIDDDAFTNGIAKMNLICAANAARVLNLPVNAEWERVAAKIRFWQFDDGVNREYSTYKGENIKQADVNLLAFPLKFVTDKTHILRDLEYYRKRLPDKGTPAMTQAIFTILYSRQGDQKKAWQYFQDAYIPNLLPPFRVIAETKGGTNPYFATGAGGVLQAVLMGFGGIDISYDGGLTQIHSVLPEHWKKLTLTSIGSEGKSYTVTK